MPLHPSTVAKIAFVHPGGLHEYARVPMGLRNAPSHFMRHIDQLIAEGGLSEVAKGFVDDLLCGGHDFEAYVHSQIALLRELRDRGWLVSLAKARFGYRGIDALGHVVEAGMVKPDPKKLECICRLLPPTSPKEVKAFLGLTGYYRRLIPGYAAMAAPLTWLLKGDAVWEWMAAHQEAFLALQECLHADSWVGVPW